MSEESDAMDDQGCEHEVQKMTSPLDPKQGEPSYEKNGPAWTCAECGSTEGFTDITHNSIDGNEYDMECNNCGSYHICESLIEALSEMASKLEKSQNEFLSTKAALAEAQKKNEDLREVLKALVNRLEFIHNDDAYKSVWILNHNRHGPYTGPKYDKQLEVAKQALSSPELKKEGV